MFNRTSSVLLQNTQPIRPIVAQLERRKPPLKASKKKIDILLNTENKTLSAWRQAQGSQISKSAQVYAKVPLLTWTDTAEDPLVEKLTQLKEDYRASGPFNFPRKFWVVNPYAIDVDIFDEKVITFVLNALHSQNKGRSFLFEKHGNFTLTAESVNKLYDWLAFRLLDCENNLYSITYTSYGIKATYISAFESIATPGQILYINHTWFTSYVFPEEGDLKAFPSTYDFKEGPLLDGWAKLITMYGQYDKNLNVGAKDFVKRKHNQDLQPIFESAEKEKGSFRIENENTLLSCPQDWRRLLLNKPEKPLFHYPPASHYSYNPNDFPNGIDSIGPKEGGEVTEIAKLPFGEFYGIKD